MVQLSFIEKLEQLFNIIKTSSLFTIIAILLLVLVISLIIDFKKNKRVNEKTFIATFVIFITFIIYRYNASLLSFADNFFEEMIKAIYFPNIAVYSLILVTINVVMLYTLIKDKYYLHKISSIITSFIINFLFLITLDLVINEKIDIYEKLTVYSNKELLSVIEITSIIFTLWVIFTAFVKLVNKTINSNVEVPVMIEQSVKEIPAYVIPTPINLTSNTYVNNALTSSLERTSYVSVNIEAEELYEKFKQGEELTRDQYIEIKKYLMTK